jgi:hypothetical protein
MKYLLVLVALLAPVSASAQGFTWKPPQSVMPDSMLLKEAVGQMVSNCELFVKERLEVIKCSVQATYLYGLVTLLDQKLLRLRIKDTIRLTRSEIEELQHSAREDILRFEQASATLREKYPLVWRAAPLPRRPI